MTQTEALKLALEALEDIKGDCSGCEFEWSNDYPLQAKAHAAIKGALAQPEEEKLHPVHIGVDVTKEGTAVTAFYRKPDAVMEMFYSQFHPLAQPEQEPVAWGFQNSAITGSNRWMMLREEIPANDQYGGALWTPLYTTPPQRTWVGLTEEELQKILQEVSGQGWKPMLEAIEAKLKEKNT